MTSILRNIEGARWQLANALRATVQHARDGKSAGLRGRRVDLRAPLHFGEREILLTFDDGPHPAVTPAILRTLALFDVTAVFFVVGDRVPWQKPLLARIAAAGHVVGSHTMTHPRLTDLTIDAASAEIRDARHVIGATLSGPPSPFFRYPYFAKSDALDALAAREGLIVIGSDVPARDWECRSAREVLANALAALDEKTSGIVLLHDIHRHTADALPAMLAELRRRSYTVLTPMDEPTPAG